MATRLRLELKGFDEYLAKIAALGRDIDEAAAKGLLAGAEIIQDSMRDLAPVDTGNLRAHIKIKGPLRDGNFTYVDVGLINEITYTDPVTARYGNVQEYGSANTPAHPFIRPGIDHARKAAMAALRESLEQDGLL